MNAITATVPAQSEKIQPHHRDRLAIVYVRQSTLQQVQRHQESTRLQYALADRAHALGRSEQRIEVIDEDLGRSGTSAEGRPGFQRLVAEVGLDHVGIVLGVDMSRLSRKPRLASVAGDLRVVRHAHRRSGRRLRSLALQ